MFSRRGFIASVLASVAHLFVAKQEQPKPDPFAVQPFKLQAERVGGSMEITDSFWYVEDPTDVKTWVVKGRQCGKRPAMPIAHGLTNMKIEYYQSVQRTGENMYVASEPTLVGQVDRYAVTHFPDGDQMCDLMTVRDTPYIVVIPLHRDGVCDIHTVIRMTGVKFGPLVVKADGTHAVKFTAGTISYTTEQKHVGTPELHGKDARQGG